MEARIVAVVVLRRTVDLDERRARAAAAEVERTHRAVVRAGEQRGGLLRVHAHARHRPRVRLERDDRRIIARADVPQPDAAPRVARRDEELRRRRMHL